MTRIFLRAIRGPNDALLHVLAVQMEINCDNSAMRSVDIPNERDLCFKVEMYCLFIMKLGDGIPWDLCINVRCKFKP